jgi:hypothetical protein
VRILICHNWYQHTGGEDNVVRTECPALSRGHEVMLLDAARVITSFTDKVGGETAHSPPPAALAQMAAMRPDGHVHNCFRY